VVAVPPRVECAVDQLSGNCPGRRDRFLLTSRADSSGIHLRSLGFGAAVVPDPIRGAVMRQPPHVSVLMSSITDTERVA
jgi:hypothetical protein